MAHSALAFTQSGDDSSGQGDLPPLHSTIVIACRISAAGRGSRGRAAPVGQVDVHAGGVDLKFPHHENEIAQSEGFLGPGQGVQWVNYWLHTGHLNILGLKVLYVLRFQKQCWSANFCMRTT